MAMNLWFDLKYAWRLLLKNLGYSLLCTVVVALSVGLAVWSYSVFYSIALKPLPFPGAERWLSIQVAKNATASAEPEIDAFTYQEVLKGRHIVDYLGAYTSRSAVLSEGQASTSLQSAAISPGLLAAMRITPQMGRLLEQSDAEAGAAPAVMLSYATWKAYFAADPSVIGKQARIDGQPMQIIGVMPKDFFAFQDSDLWFPLQPTILGKPSDSSLVLSAFAVLDGDQHVESLLSEMKPAVDKVNQEFPKTFSASRHIALFPANLMVTHDQLPFTAMIGFTAIAVLLLGCVNIGLVFFARLLERSRELALRTALGSSRGRLLRQCLLESLLVILLGLVIGIVMAALAIHWAQGIGEFIGEIMATGRSPTQFALHSGDLLIASVAALVLWLLSTLIPAWRIAKQDAAVALSGSGKGVAGAGSAKTASFLVGLQVIISCLVLIICANLVIAVHKEVSKPTGINTSGIMVSTYPTEFGARFAETSKRLNYWDALTGAIKAQIPGTDVAFATAIPTRPNNVPVAIEHREGTSDQGTLKLPVVAVTEGYFNLIGLSVRQGRLFDGTDNEAGLEVAVVDKDTATHYWPQQNVIGKRIQLNPSENGTWLTIVGVVSPVAAEPYGDSIGVIYRPLRQAVPGQFHLIAKLPSNAVDARAALRVAAYSIDRDLPLHNLQLLDDYLKALDIGYKSIVPVFSVIASITVILAATGLFGLISRSVARRTQEVGIRRALGGTRWQVTAVFLRQGVLYLSVGLIGGCVGIVITNLLSAAIPNILASVVAVTLGVFVLIAIVIFAASYLPTRRAVALEPGDALRYE